LEQLNVKYRGLTFFKNFKQFGVFTGTIKEVYEEDGACEDIPVSELQALLQPGTETSADSCSVERLNQYGVEWQTKHLFKETILFVHRKLKICVKERKS
jgi:hypothetical protein